MYGSVQCEPSKLFIEKYTFNGILQHFKTANNVFVGAKWLASCAFAFYTFIAFIALIFSYCVKSEIAEPSVRKWENVHSFVVPHLN